MKISALIPAYKAAGTIEATLESILAQTQPPDEILVLLDGVVDDTPKKLEKFTPRVTVHIQENRGVACARNRLVELASGDLLAFLDADDLWHPDYLKNQHALFAQYPNAVAVYTGHLRFRGGDHLWSPEPPAPAQPELLDPVTFFTRYNITTAVFGSMSYCCVRKSVMDKISPNPFSPDLHAVEDSYLAYQLALVGPVAFLPTRLVAYRLMEGSLSENRVRNLGRWATAFERLEAQYRSQPSRSLMKVFAKYYASKRREYAKVLLGVGRSGEARAQILSSLRNCGQPASLVKSLGLLAASLLPKWLQPAWPSSVRVLTKPSHSNAAIRNQ